MRDCVLPKRWEVQEVCRHKVLSLEKMKVLLHYTPGPLWHRELASLSHQGFHVDRCDETDDQRFYSLLPETEVLWHGLRPISAADIAKAAKLRLIQKNWRALTRSISRRREIGASGLQHAQDKYPSCRRNDVVADAGLSLETAGLRPCDARRSRREADMISLHVPLAASTANLIDR
jgi:hypothetical protein